MNKFIIILMVIIILYGLYKANYKPKYINTFDNIEIQIINMKDRPDRKQRMIKELIKHDINGNFYEAINGMDLDIDDMYKKGMIKHQDSDRIMRRGEYGCYLSHTNIYKDFLDKSNKKYLLIFEDDAILGNDFKNDCLDVLDNLDRNEIQFDMLFLSTNCRDKTENCSGRHITTKIYKPVDLGYGMHTYIVTKEGAKKLLDWAFPIRWPIDVLVEYKFKSNNPTIRIYKTVKSLSHINDSGDSDTTYIK